VVALYFACRHHRTPWYAKALAIVVVGYAISPIDLIPDFIPVIGYLDDLVLLPIGVVVVRALVPAEVMVESREKARQLQVKPQSRIGAAVIVLVWLVLGAAVLWWWVR